MNEGELNKLIAVDKFLSLLRTYNTTISTASSLNLNTDQLTRFSPTAFLGSISWFLSLQSSLYFKIIVLNLYFLIHLHLRQNLSVGNVQLFPHS
jgi:hypothetical protein